MAKIIYISCYNDSSPFALQGQKAGDDVLFYAKKHNKGGTGMIKIIPNLPLTPDKDRIAIFDMSRNGKLADKWRAQGIPVFGGGSICDDLELDQRYGMRVMETCGIRIPETHWFNSFEDGIKFLSKTDEPWVFKPSGDQMTALTVVPSDPKELTASLGYYKSRWKGKVDFLLQKKVDGVEVSIEGWWNGQDFWYLNSTLEDKRFKEDEYGLGGPNTGCSDSLVFAYKNPNPKLYQLTLAKMVTFLRKVDYPICPIDINTIISDDDHLPYALELTPRLGYSAIFAFAELWGVTFDEFVISLLEGREIDIDRESYAGSLRIAIPPYPNSEDTGAKEALGLPLPGLEGEQDNPHIWMLDVMKEGGKLVCAGDDGIIAELTEKDKTLDGLRKKIYKMAEGLHLPNKMGRTDFLDKRFKFDLQEFKDWGYLK